MVEAIEWEGAPVANGGVLERAFRVSRGSRVSRAQGTDGGWVPGLLWWPESADPGVPKPLVLLGHGGSGDKRTGHHVELARWFVVRAGFAALAIDGPYHGDRVPAPLEPADYQARIAREGIEVVLDRMAEDWEASIAALGAAGLVDVDRLAYVGMSMGARFGLPLAVRLGARLRCAVLGKFGLLQSPDLHAGLAAPERFGSDARAVGAPVLFHVQWDDEIFPRDGQLALFDALGSADKHLVGFPGRHGETDPEASRLWREFVRDRLSGAADPHPAAEPVVRAATAADRSAIAEVLTASWGSTTVVVRGAARDASDLPALVAERAGRIAGVLTYEVADGALEVVSLDAVVPGVGIGSALLAAAVETARDAGARRLWLVTTNDNLDALRFYQRRGLRMVDVAAGAVDAARALKPTIPTLGAYDIPIRDELTLELRW